MRYQKLKKAIIYLASGIWAIPVILLIRSIRPVVLIRFGSIDPMRIGHFVQDFGIAFAKKAIEKNISVDLYYLQSTKEGRTSNQFWEALVKRNFYVHPLNKYLFKWNSLIPGGKLHTLQLELGDRSSRDPNGYLAKSERTMSFLPEENAVARQWLINQGWKQGERFVCFLVRDDTYLAETFPDVDFAYHTYRNSDILNYHLAAEWLAEQGAWVFRMGSSSTQPFSVKNSRIIDYAHLPTKTPFLDIWLFANCDLCVTSLSGPDAICDIFKRPVLAVDYLPFYQMRTWSEFIGAPKRLRWTNSGKELTLREYIEANFLRSELYTRSGISILPLSPEDILDTTKEAWARIYGGWEDQESSLEDERVFWTIFRAHSSFPLYHGFIHPKARVSRCWIEGAGDDFLH